MHSEALTQFSEFTIKIIFFPTTCFNTKKYCPQFSLVSYSYKQFSPLCSNRAYRSFFHSLHSLKKKEKKKCCKSNEFYTNLQKFEALIFYYSSSSFIIYNKNLARQSLSSSALDLISNPRRTT